MSNVSQLSNMIPRAFGLADYSMPFWIDTLCIPRHPMELRRRAISRMREPFAKANIVRIFVNSLTGFKSRGLSEIEMFARLKVSNWSKRLWTYQEDAVGPINYVQFNDQAVDILRQGVPLRRSMMTMSNTLEKFSFSRKEVGDPRTTFKDVGSAFRTAVEQSREPLHSSPVKFFRYGLSPHASLGSGLHWHRYMLQTRTTSSESDQALCLASMMGLDVAKIAQVDSEDRMQGFWSLVQSLPVGILFSKSTKKLNAEGLRWAPASFLEVNDGWMGPRALHKNYVDRSLGDKGLRVKLPVIFLQPLGARADRSNSDAHSLKTLFERIHGEGDKVRLFDDAGNGWNVQFEEDWHKTYRMGDCDGLAIVLEPQKIEPGTTYWGILASCEKRDGSIRAQAHRHVKAKKVPKPLPGLSEGFEACTKVMLSRYDPEILAQLLRAPKKAKDPDKVDEAREYLKEFLAQQEGFVEQDCEYWRLHDDKPEDSRGHKTKSSEAIDTVAMWSLLWPNVRAELSQSRLEFCID